MSLIFHNGGIFSSVKGDCLHDAMLVEEGKVAWIGDKVGAMQRAKFTTNFIDLNHSVVLPGLVDAHTHLVMFGGSMTKVDMLSKTSAEVQQALRAARSTESTQILGKSFMFDALGQKPHRSLLDDAVPEIPVFIDSADLHSCWLNSKAIEMVGITEDSPNPSGGSFERDDHGNLTGLFLETAVTDVVWPYLAKQLSLEDRIRLLKMAFDAYLASGVTTTVDMAMEDGDLEALEEYERRYGLPLRVLAHWIIGASGTSEDHKAEVYRAAEHRDRLSKLDNLSVVGIKIISDGVVDSCTAYLTKPYANGTLADPIWPIEKLRPVVVLADSLDLQIAVHAIGDAASEQALDVFEHTINTNPPRQAPRFRIEHLEVVSPESIQKLTRLGVVASLQPVHADPVYVPNWRLMLNEDERCDRAFPWTEFADSHVAFGSDAPTAPHHPFPNLYTATTRRSGVDTKLGPSTDPRIKALERFCIPLDRAIRYYTAGSAYSIRDNQRGTLQPGKFADFCIIAIDPFLNGVESLREAQESVMETWVSGRRVWKRSC